MMLFFFILSELQFNDVIFFSSYLSFNLMMLFFSILSKLQFDDIIGKKDKALNLRFFMNLNVSLGILHALVVLTLSVVGWGTIEEGLLPVLLFVFDEGGVDL